MVIRSRPLHRSAPPGGEAIALFGPVSTVYAELRALTTRTEDDVFLALHHASGTVSHLWASSVAAAPGPRSRALGSEAAFLVPGHDELPGPFDPLNPGIGMTGWLVRGTESTPVPTAPGEHADFYRAAARWLRHRGPAPVDPWDAVSTAAVLDAARRSASPGSGSAAAVPLSPLGDDCIEAGDVVQTVANGQRDARKGWRGR